ncbi:hypothetical protein D3C84_1059060 [compost metagenome]
MTRVEKDRSKDLVLLHCQLQFQVVTDFAGRGECGTALEHALVDDAHGFGDDLVLLGPLLVLGVV